MFPDSRTFKSGAGRKAASLVAASCAGVMFSVAVAAAEYSLDPSFRGRITANDNLLLSSEGGEIKTFLLELTPRLRARRATEKWQADLDASVTAVRLEDDEFDADNQNVSFELTRRAETILFQVIALNSRQTTRSVELDELGEIGFEIERRDRQFLRPSVTWTMNQTNQFSVGISGDNVHYGGLDFSDYDYYNADIAWTHQFDEKTQFNVTAFGSDYSSELAQPQLARASTCLNFFGPDFPAGVLEDFSSETVGLRIGGSRQPSSRFSYRGSVGYRKVDTTGEGGCFFAVPNNDTFTTTSTSNGLVLDTGFDYRGETYQVGVSLSRSVSPAGLGSINERDDLRVNWSYRFNELLTLSLAVTAFDTSSLDPDINFAREGLQVAPRATWQVNEKFSVNGGFIYRSTESENTSGKRDGQSIYAGFNYNFKPIRFTR